MEKPEILTEWGKIVVAAIVIEILLICAILSTYT